MTGPVARQLVADLLQLGLTVTISPRDVGFEVSAQGDIDLTQLTPLAQKYTVSAPTSNARFV